VCPYFGILAENPFPPGRGYITGAAALTPLGATPQTPFLRIISVFRQTEIMLCFCDKEGGWNGTVISAYRIEKPVYEINF
jgi:hypothetical protein